MRFKKSPQVPGAGSARAWHHHGSDTPTFPRAIYVLKSANSGLHTTEYSTAVHICYSIRLEPMELFESFGF